jgi:hypothetical protein
MSLEQIKSKQKALQITKIWVKQMALRLKSLEQKSLGQVLQRHLSILIASLFFCFIAQKLDHSTIRGEIH